MNAWVGFRLKRTLVGYLIICLAFLPAACSRNPSQPPTATDPAAVAESGGPESVVAAASDSSASSTAMTDPATQDAATPATGSAQQLVSMTPVELADTFSDDPAEAARKYEGKTIEVTGVARYVDGNEMYGTLTFETPEGEQTIPKFITADREPWATVLPGQTVKAVAKFDEEWQALKLHIVEVEGPRLIVTATEIANDYQSDPAAMDTNLQGKYLEVQGRVTKIDKNEVGAAEVLLEATADVVVSCRFANTEEAQVDALRLGNETRIVGFYSSQEENEVTLLLCQRISDAAANEDLSTTATAESRGATRNLDYVADSFCAAIVIHPPRVARSPFGDAIPLQTVFDQLFEGAELTTESVERVTVLIDPFPREDVPFFAGAVFEFSEPVEAERLVQGWTGLRKQVDGDLTIYLDDEDTLADETMAACMVRPQTFLVGLQPTLEKMLSAKPADSLLVNTLRGVDLGHEAQIVFAAAPLRDQLRELVSEENTGELPPGIAQFRHVVEYLTVATLTVDLTGPVLLRLALEAESDAAASLLLQLAQAAQELADETAEFIAPALAETAPPDLQESLRDVLMQAMTGIEVGRNSGRRVALHVTKPENAETFAGQLAETIAMAAASPEPPDEPAAVAGGEPAEPPAVDATIAPPGEEATTRLWKDRTGKHSVEAELVDFKGDVVRLKRADGNVISLKLEQLSDADQQFLRSRSALPPTPAPPRAAGKQTAKLGGRGRWPTFLLPPGAPADRNNDGVVLPNHTYLRTRAADFGAKDFVFEVVYLSTEEDGMLFFGIGEGLPEPGFGEPTASIKLRVHPPGARHKGAVHLSRGGDGGGQKVGELNRPGVHRVILEKTGNALTLSIQADDDGPSADDVQTTVPDIFEYAPYLHQYPTHLFFGGKGEFREVEFRVGPRKPEN